MDEAFVQVGRLRIEKGQHRVWIDAEPIKLSAKIALLEYLGRSSGEVVSAQDLIEVAVGSTPTTSRRAPCSGP